ncbi:MAG: hypothetical protein ABIJ95_08140 [Pseudomonadota bacterium]
MPAITVSQFGAFRFSGGARFSEAVTFTVTRPDFLEGRFGLAVGVYEPGTGARKDWYASDADQSVLVSVQFESLETGCGAFSLTVNAKPGDLVISRGDIIEIHLMGSRLPWYAGKVLELPGVDTGKEQYVYKGHGLFSELANVLVDETYPGTGDIVTIEGMVSDLAENYLPGDIRWFADRLSPMGYRVQAGAGSIRFDRTTLKEAMGKLAELAGGRAAGVNEDRELFFSPVQGRPVLGWANRACQWVGRHLDGFSLSEKDEVANRLHVKIGSVSTSDSNFADFTVQDTDSQAFFGVREAVVSAPQIKNETDAATWAEYELANRAWPTVTGKAKNLDLSGWVTSRDDMIRAGEYMRISMPRAGLSTPFQEPLNGYYRWCDLDSAQVYDLNQVKRHFSPRRSGPLGRVEVMARKVGSPGALSVSLEQVGPAIPRIYSPDASGDIHGWFSWVCFDFSELPVVYYGQTWALILSVDPMISGPSDYYEVLSSSQDAPFSGGYFASTDGGSSWAEDTGLGILFRAYLTHADEFALAVKKVKYSADADGGIRADVDLGEVDRPLENRILAMLRAIKAEELLQQSNVATLAP